MSRGSRVTEFVRLTEPCHKQLFGIALALSKDRDKASDLTQETLVRAFEAFDRFIPGAPVMPWLRRILKNLFLDSFKTGRARHEIADSELGEGEGSSLFVEAKDEAPDALALLERSELSNLLREEISCLDPDHRQILMLCVMQDMSFQEAAELLGIPLGTVASRLARARTRLRTALLRRQKRSEEATVEGRGGPAGDQPDPRGAAPMDQSAPLTRRSDAEEGPPSSEVETPWGQGAGARTKRTP
jgi:RNA polymerase sigma-70 factor, ECF subfamily